MLHTLCRTLPELERDLAAGPITSPVFALTRPLDLHIGNIASATVPPGESYPDFYGPYAARVHRMDTCVGDFIESLKRLGLYDHSIIVLTSDHGDSLGEGQRWGHGVAIFPEVIRVPLIVHLPPALRSRFSTDLTRLAFSTDLTPTLYALLGAPPAPTASRGVRDLLKGSPLFS
jgi:arylsulfatase A-like enzyme